MQKHQQPQGIADYIIATGKRKIKNDFFEQIVLSIGNLSKK